MEPEVHHPDPLPAAVASITRHVLTLGAGVLIGKGWVTAEQAPELVGAVMTLVAVGWSFVRVRGTQRVLKQVGVK